MNVLVILTIVRLAPSTKSFWKEKQVGISLDIPFIRNLPKHKNIDFFF